MISASIVLYNSDLKTLQNTIDSFLKTPLKKIIDEEVKWDETKTVISKTDVVRTILYANDAFTQS